MKVNLVDPMPFHPLLRHPGTNRPLRAIGLNSNGLPIWPLLGGDGEDDATGDDAEDDEDSDEEADEEGDESAEDNKDSKKGKKRTGPVSREEFDAQTRRLAAADRRRQEAEDKAAALQKEKDEKERKDKPELENLRKDHGDLVKAHENLEKNFKKLALENAFHTASAQAKIAWHNPKVALRSADLEDLEIDEKGEVDGILDVVKALAKSNKFLVNTGKESDEEEDDKPPARRGASGSGVGSAKTSKGKKNNGQLSTEELRRRFPALNKR